MRHFADLILRGALISFLVAGPVVGPALAGSTSIAASFTAVAAASGTSFSAVAVPVASQRPISVPARLRARSFGAVAAGRGVALRDFVAVAAESGEDYAAQADEVAQSEQAGDDLSAPPGSVTRQRVGGERRQEDAVPAPQMFPPPGVAGRTEDEMIAIPDRWRLVETLRLKEENVLDPYNQNTLKADRPIFGKDWFLNVLLVSDSLAELRSIPTPVGVQANRSAGRIDAFGSDDQNLYSQNIITSFSLIKGDTTFRPPDWEFRFTGITNLNYAISEVEGLLEADPTNDQQRRYDSHFAFQELFVDKHLRNKSDRYDFDSLRIGIQPFISDFRGFVFQDQQPGIRLFGNFINNRLQYNLAAFRRFNKDTNSGLNENDELRDDDVYIANLYYQDFPFLGIQTQGTVIYNRNREGDRRERFDENDFIKIPAAIGNQKPHNYDVFYLGLNGDGHIDRFNITYSIYNARGTDTRNQIADRSTNINAWFGALETSIDFDWYRFKAYTLYSSGDKNPLDSEATGFDAIFDNAQFAGADTSYFQRQSIPFIGGGGVIFSGRNSFIPSLRSSKEEGQSNFVNPGLRMLGVGADFDVLPELRIATNLSYLDFDDTSVLSILRQQGKVDSHIGEDVSVAFIYRPLFIQNIQVRLAAAALFPGEGLDDLFDDNDRSAFYSLIANVVLQY
jgi:hypothetical protein